MRLLEVINSDLFLKELGDLGISLSEKMFVFALLSPAIYFTDFASKGIATLMSLFFIAIGAITFWCGVAFRLMYEEQHHE